MFSSLGLGMEGLGWDLERPTTVQPSLSTWLCFGLVDALGCLFGVVFERFEGVVVVIGAI